MNYPWPGNVRELRNVIERAVALTVSPQIILNDLPEKIIKHSIKQLVFSGDDPSSLQSLAEVEQRYILHVLDVCRNNRTATAQVLGMDRKTLYRKLRQYGVDDSDSDD
ncbi:MAG: helix-turn-helix domain-containing protein [Pirellulales bacterium]